MASQQYFHTHAHQPSAFPCFLFNHLGDSPKIADFHYANWEMFSELALAFLTQCPMGDLTPNFICNPDARARLFGRDFASRFAVLLPFLAANSPVFRFFSGFFRKVQNDDGSVQNLLLAEDYPTNTPLLAGGNACHQSWMLVIPINCCYLITDRQFWENLYHEMYV